ncbi:MAG: endonuclease/exonuclease/phosphatase family protein [Planctomycetota bacterium]|nr:MAG: endonuclease/exonuclease/phosphatase family protein [Planctomycetota bacterium]
MRKLLAVVCGMGMSLGAWAQNAEPMALRVATFNILDVRPSDVQDGTQPRLRQLAETIQRIRPNVILLNEIAFAAPDDYSRPETGAWTAEQFNMLYLAVPQREGLEPMSYRVYTSRPNTGMPSGFDLDRDGQAVSAFPLPEPAGDDGRPTPPSERGRAYGNDCWGFGTFPGQYGMALLVDERLIIDEDNVRTFRLFPWRAMPDAELPRDENGDLWYDEKVLSLFRLSSKSHWDVPVVLPNGSTVHFLCSHPTPPAFDGIEGRNKRRNHDEIRFWADYIAGADYIVDDAEQRGGLAEGAAFVILGDLNADPDEGDSHRDPIDRFLLGNKRINSSLTPVSDIPVDGLDADDTAAFGFRVDYVLPSADIRVLRGGVWRWADGSNPSDHYPVWVDIAVPAGE